MSGPDVLGALQRTLTAEHAAVYEYAVLGARTSESAAPEVYASIKQAYIDHRAQRDRLVGDIAALGATPVPAAATYDSPSGLATLGGVERAALDLERNCAATYSWLVAQTSGARREWAVGLLTRSAVRELAFRGTPEIFPGAAEYADR